MSSLSGSGMRNITVLQEMCSDVLMSVVSGMSWFPGQVIARLSNGL